MFGSGRVKQAERVAEDAWEALVDAVESAGDAARSAGKRSKKLAGKAQDRVGSATDEAVYRASAAYDALAGRRAALPWGLILTVAVAGAVAGFVAARVAERAIEAASRELPPADDDPADALAAPLEPRPDEI